MTAAEAVSGGTEWDLFVVGVEGTELQKHNKGLGGNEWTHKGHSVTGSRPR